jgi:hypothetical protein
MVTFFIWGAHHLLSGNVVLARFGQRQTAFTQKRLLICTLRAAFGILAIQTCGMFYLKGREFVWRALVKESEPFELDWLLTCKLEELIASVRPMSAKNCEKIARVILDRIGGPSFEQLLMRIVETMVPRDGRGPPTNSDELYFSIRDLFPHVPPENDVLGRLLCFAMRMCQLRIEKNPNLTAN